MRLIYLALGWVCGIVLAASNPAPPAAQSVFWLALCAMAVPVVWLLRDWLPWPALALLALTLGGFRFSLAPTGNDLLPFNNLGGVSIEGVAGAAPVLNDQGMRLRVRVDTLVSQGARRSVTGDVLVLARPDREIQPGDRVRATGLLQGPGTRDDFSWSEHLARSGVFSIMREASLERLAPAEAASLQSALHSLNRRVARLISWHLPAPESALLRGIVLGDESGLAPDLRQAFSDTGAAHVIAISGFNMIVLSGAVTAMLRRSSLARGKSAAIAVAVMALYTLFVGASAPVLRAALMSSLLVFAGAMRRRVFAPASLSLAVLLMSLENPTVLWDVGFQLSVFATLGIMLLAAPLGSRLERILPALLPAGPARRAGDLLLEPLVVSLAAWIATLPLILRYFSRLSLVALPVNLLIVPAQAPLLILGLLASATALVAPLPAQFLFWLDLLPLTWTTEIVQAAARLPHAAMDLRVDPRHVSLFYLSLVAAMLLRAARSPLLQRLGRLAVKQAGGGLTLLLAAGLLLLLVMARLSRPDGMLHLWLLDVGHGNAVLLQGPSGEHILIDVGHAPSRLLTALGERMPFHDRRLEVLALTVPDPQAEDALQSLLQRHEVGLLLHNGHRELPSILRDGAEEIVVPRAGHTLRFGQGLALEVLHPAAPPPPEQRRFNSSALVFRVRYGDVSFLLPASLDREGQLQLLAEGVSPAATVLQLPLHGAARSLEADFLRAARAQLAMVHVDPEDPRNRRGDPDPDVLALLGDTPLLRSDRNGALHFWSDGERLWRDVLPAERAAG